MIHRGPEEGRGIAVGRFDDREGAAQESVAIFGYSGEVAILRPRADGAWSSSVLFRDRDLDKGHWPAAGELDDGNATTELVVSG